MALGSSAPEILLSVIEVLNRGFYAGALGHVKTHNAPGSGPPSWPECGHRSTMAGVWSPVVHLGRSVRMETDEALWGGRREMGRVLSR